MLDRIFVRLLLLPLLMSCLCADSSASELGLRQLHHRSWHARDGAPSDVHRVVQDKAGFLWLATTGGLFRFDGVRFESVESIYHVALWTSEVISLQVSRDGGLWIGYRFGGASYLRDGKITHYQYQLKGDNFFPGAGVRGFAEDKDGTIWAITDRLNQFKNNKWQAIEPGIPKGRGTGLLIDRRGGVWAAFASGVYWRRDERSGFIKVSESSKPTHFAEAPDGTIWAVTDAQGLARFDPASGRLLGTMPGSDRGMRSGRPMFDREGNLWCASLDASVQRITAQDLAKDAQLTQQFVEEFSEKDGLSGGLVTNVLQDREGNVWVATSSGIDRFRESPVSRIPVPVPQGAVVLGMAPADGRQFEKHEHDVPRAFRTAVDGQSRGAMAA
jgi:ligand-binding sensor domain-containing protein